MAFQIRQVRVRPLRMPTSDHARLSFASMTDRRTLLLEVQDEDGCVGVGECWANHPPWGLAERVALARNLVAPALVGTLVAGPRSAARGLLQTLLPAAEQGGSPGPVNHVVSGFEMALWDLLGKRLGVSVAALLGGAVRDRVPAYGSSLQTGDQGMAERLESGGLTAVKCRVGINRERDQALVSDARAVVGEEGRLFIDANRAWDARAAEDVLPSLATAGVEWVEEPLNAADPAAMARLHAATGIPIALGENLSGVAQFVPLIQQKAVRVWQPDVAKVGGIGVLAGVCDLAEAAETQVIPHWYSGPVGLAATLQVAAAKPVVDCVEFDIRDNPLHACVQQRLMPVDGNLHVPDGPGLGIDLDHDAIDKLEEKP